MNQLLSVATPLNSAGVSICLDPTSFQGVYANTTTARVDAVPDVLPDWLLSGKYWVRADAWGDGRSRRHVGCLQFDFKLS